MHNVGPSMTTARGAIARSAVVLLLAALSLVGGVAVTAAAVDDDVPWAVRTASNSFGADRQNYSYTLDPGGQLEDAVMVVNHGTAPLELDLYGADGFTTDAGRLDLVTKDVTSTGVGAWVHAGRDQLEVPAGESVEMPFTVTVPPNATPGDHMGGIVTALTQAACGSARSTSTTPPNYSPARRGRSPCRSTE